MWKHCLALAVASALAISAHAATVSVSGVYRAVTSADPNTFFGEETSEVTINPTPIGTSATFTQGVDPTFSGNNVPGVITYTDPTNPDPFTNTITLPVLASRPIKVNGLFKGVYCWIDVDSSGSGSAVDEAVIISFDNSYFANLPAPFTVRSSSDRVDSSLNQLLGPNSAPVGVNDTYSVNEDTTLTVTAANGVLLGAGADTDGDSDALSVVSYTVAGNATTYTAGTSATITNVGTLTLNENGSLTFVPVLNYNGTVPLLTYTLSDNLATATATLSLTVNAVNDAPVGGRLPNGTVDPDFNIANNRYQISTPEDTPVNGTVRAYDADGDTLAYSVATLPTNGTVIVNPNGTYTYTPALNFHGTDSFTVNVSDGNGGTTTITVFITVTPVNDAPVGGRLPNGTVDPDFNIANNRYQISTPEDTPVNGTVRAYDADGDTLTFTRASNPANGTVSVNADGSYLYTPTANYHGPDSFTILVRDPLGAEALITVAITVTPVNDLPIGGLLPNGAPDPAYNAALQRYEISTNQDSPISGQAQAFDQDGDPLTFSAGTAPGNGTVSVNSSGSYTYTPANGFSGTDTFTLTVSDGQGGTAVITIVVRVYAAPVNALPQGTLTFGDEATPVTDQNGSTFSVSDADSTVLTVRLSAERGLLTLPNLAGVSLLEGSGFNDSAVVIQGPIANLNTALAELRYVAASGVDKLTIVTTDERGQTDRDTLDTQYKLELATLGGSNLGTSLQAIGTLGRELVSARVVRFDPTLLRSVETNGTGANARLSLGSPARQDGSEQETTVLLELTYADGSTGTQEVAVKVYNPRLTIVSQLKLNPQTSLYEQTVQVTNSTPFLVDSFRLVVPSLPAGVKLYTSSINLPDGTSAIEDLRRMEPGATRNLVVEYFAPGVQQFTEPKLTLLINSAGALPTPVGTVAAVDRVVVGAAKRTYVEFNTIANRTYWVQYRDEANDIWLTSPIAINGTGTTIHWLDEGAPKTLSAPTVSRQYRLIVASGIAAPLNIATQPASQNLTTGESGGLSVTMGAGGPYTYQWYRDGTLIPGATTASLPLSASDNEGDYYVLVSDGRSSLRSRSATIKTQSDNPGRIVNLSVRSSLAADTLITGFVIQGTGPRAVLMRGVGETLRNFGVASAASDPAIRLFSGSRELTSNDDWALDPTMMTTRQVTTSSGAFQLSESSKDAAMVRQLTAGSYTLHTTQRGTQSGTILAELYDAAGRYDSANRITNISARAAVSAGEGVLIAGIVIGGDTTCRLLVRGIGPTLTGFGVAGALADPELALYRAGNAAPVATNDDWGSLQSTIQGEELFSRVGAFEFAPGSKDAVLVSRVSPGAYTVVLSGKGAAQGQALIEIYLID